MRLICAQFGVHVAGTRVPLELDLVRMPLRGLVLDSGDLGGIPGESVRIERRREGDPLSFMGWVVDHFVLAADAPPVIILLVVAILAQDVGSRIFEVAVDQMVRQAARVVGGEPDFAVGLGLGGLGGVLLATLVRRDLAGGIRRVLVIGQLVGTGEFDIVKIVAGIPFRGRDGFEGETYRGDPVGHEIRAGVRIPLLVVRAVGRGRGRDGGHLLADLVAVLGRDAGGLLRGLLVWFADHDLHLIHVGAGRAGMLQTPFHHGARRDLHILVDRGALLVGGQFGELVVVDGIVIEFHIAGLAAHTAGIMRVSLGGAPGETRPVPIGNGPACGGHGASRTVFAGTGIDGGEPLALVVFVRTRPRQSRP